jgi:hypothetical protein
MKEKLTPDPQVACGHRHRRDCPNLVSDPPARDVAQPVDQAINIECADIAVHRAGPGEVDRGRQGNQVLHVVGVGGGVQSGKDPAQAVAQQRRPLGPALGEQLVHGQVDHPKVVLEPELPVPTIWDPEIQQDSSKPRSTK